MSVTGIEQVRAWILSKHPDRVSLGADENLIESRLVDSLSFAELVYVIEEASGLEIDFESLDIQDFQTISSVEKAFFN
jgi:acyl carrier protein